MKQTLSYQNKSLVFGWFICLLGALFYTYEYLLRIEPGIMVNDLSHHFALDATGVGLLASAYYWAYTPLQLVVGLVLDRFGARHTLLSALLFCILGTFIFGFVDNVWIAGTGRFMTGVGSAFAFVGSLKLCADWLPKKYFSFFAGLCTSLGMLGAMFGETAMSYTVDHLSWHPVITDSLWLGIILFSIFFLFIIEKNETTKKEPIRFAFLFQNVFKIARSKKILQAGFIGCALYLSLSVLGEQWGNSYIQKIFNIRAESASYFVDMIFLGWLIGSPIQGILSEKLKSRRCVLIIGCVLSLVTFLPLIICPLALSKGVFALLLFLFSFFCSAEINCFAVGHDVVDHALTATAVGFMNACIMVGGMIIQPFFAFCLDFFASNINTVHANMHHTLSDYQHALWIIPIFLVIACVFAWRMEDSYQ
ncbi:MAG: MFS transporter [Coxiellaceae bacterium]|nr:MFS transporter [Coxiellaceae bacterium]